MFRYKRSRGFKPQKQEDAMRNYSELGLLLLLFLAFAAPMLQSVKHRIYSRKEKEGDS